MRKMLVAALCLFVATTAAAAPFAWPGGAQAAVSLGYDDGLASQLDHVVPALNKRGLRASFYLPINSPTLPARQDEWKAAAAAGHELGNHSLFHGCSAKGAGREWVLPHRDLEKQTPVQVQEHILAANTWLQSLDGKTKRTFTPPCLDMKAGSQDFVAALKPHFVAYRAAGPGMVTDAAQMDPYAMPVYFVEGWSGEQLIALVEKAASQRALVSLLFHGVGAEHLSVTREAHDQLLDHLAKNKARLWTDTMVNVMENARKQAGR
ncbi:MULTISPECIES: polysaccharide deacetylase family protein [unclassified Roseateles]|uniref:polysaccharide deacetylase family protein n=1 Tax=unclassified Roseateles TaxID=2626991 RepID=UPI0006F3C7FE|nr:MULTISPECIES: polysaccharide deacetylase family protein [unclassified Roseateles]KQW41128.1 polysaccharide deacetylase [Pelomonas sp. Root405]KRA67900.1 polysaccharide deacetylase [Pelomonas sp. Root662]